MKTKTLLLVAAFIIAGIIPAVAQSNPGSTNGTDVEMQLTWPDGAIYNNSAYINEYALYWWISGGNYDTEKTITEFSWQETAGGGGLQKDTYTSAGSLNTNYDNTFTWPGGRMPEFGIGTELSLLNGSTNVSGPPVYGYAPSVVLGSISYSSSDGSTTLNYNQQMQFVMETGGEAGSTDSELYGITACAEAITYTETTYMGIPYYVYSLTTAIPPEQIQVGNLGNLTPSGTDPLYGLPCGTVYAVLPTHQEVPVTPKVGGSAFIYAHMNAQGYQLVSQCVATTPTNQARTIIGVGEQVNLSFNPTLPTNAVWSTTAGGFSVRSGTTTQLTAPSNAANVTVTATVFGKSINKIFSVVEPTGIDHAQITGTNSYPLGAAGAGMTNTIWIAPTSVSFYRVSVLEIGEDATNIWGFFSQWTPQQLHHSTADKWTALNQANQFKDAANFGSYSSWGTGGGFTWNIPERWQVTGSGVTNSMTGCAQIFSIDVNGAASIDKYGNWIQRTTNNVITTN